MIIALWDKVTTSSKNNRGENKKMMWYLRKEPRCFAFIAISLKKELKVNALKSMNISL